MVWTSAGIARITQPPPFSEIFTVTRDNDLGPKLEPTMINELKRLIVLPVAFALFLCAAQASVGISWRGAPAVTTGILR
jgi:hypothetical protein